MTTPLDPDRQIHAFLLEGDELLNDQIYDVVRAEIERKRQRTFIGPWRTPIMSKLLTYGLGAAAVVVILFGASQFFGSPGGIGGDPTPSPTVEPTPLVTPLPTTPPLTQTFNSTRHGYSISIPAGWSNAPAAEPWTSSTFPANCDDPQIDLLYQSDLQCGLFLIIGSQPIGEATPEAWVTEQMTTADFGCGTGTDPYTLGEATGRIGRDGCDTAVVATADRGYFIKLYTGDNVPLTYGHAFFLEVMATMQLHPEDAVD